MEIRQSSSGLHLSCSCDPAQAGWCEPQVQVLLALLARKPWRLFFDAAARRHYLTPCARDFGLDVNGSLEEHLELCFDETEGLRVRPRQAGLFAVSAAAKQELIGQLLSPPRPAAPAEQTLRLLILGRHRYYGHLLLYLGEAGLSSTGKLRNPVTLLNPLDEVWRLADPTAMKFYSGLARLQQNYDDVRSAATLTALRAVVLNPENLPVYVHDGAVADKPTAASLQPVTLRCGRAQVHLQVDQRGEFYEVGGELRLDDQAYPLTELRIRYEYFVVAHGAWHLLDDLDVWRVVDFFQRRNNTLLIHQSKFAEFQADVLARLEDRLQVRYSYVRPATAEQIVSAGFDAPPQGLLYLTDAGPHVELLPVMRYGPREVPVLSHRQVYATDELGRPFLLARDAAAEARFTAALLRHLPDPEELRSPGNAWSLPRAYLLREEWFIAAFEEWQKLDITVLGFNELRGNRLNPHRAQISVRVSGKNDWFDTELKVQFGPQRARLRQLQLAARKRSRYVTLDDGTRGILPAEWLEKFQDYFAAGEVVDERLRTPSVSFATLARLYDENQLDAAARTRLARFQAAAADFTGIAPVPKPAGLQAQLRDYQQQGLRWLSFLAEFGFGGCLADDMGLGKTLQVLALLQHRREQPGAENRGPSLVVVPTSLLFNWQAEAARFTPHLRVLALHGQRRPGANALAAADLVLTTYNTLVSDINWLRRCAFDYVVLDEAQAIKNPDSQRYKAACLLTARQRLVLTGTPVENQTLDLHALLSFACPGLLGSRAYFRDHYLLPIDKFEDEARARELQLKIKPFVLRRTKAQVLTQLPAKTEITLYCELGAGQRHLYDACRAAVRARLLGQLEEAPGRQGLHLLRGLTRLRQLCNSPALLPDEESYGVESAKLQVLLEELTQRTPHHKVLVFSQFVGMLELIRPELDACGIRYALLTGRTRDRAAVVSAFQEDEAVRVLLVSLKAGGVGLNLTAADYVYLVDPWWNPAVENQAIDRSHRLGQTRKVVAVRLICPGTVEEKMQELQQGKRALASELIQTDAALLKHLSREDLLQLLS
ncbi:DEAD/DEAH box helicase [Solirubrum puertoriconensis]|uniref:Helicase SNF2 n=1 Tax=Solirubrum puertoriconensis TaxID=1751427 RepID=A0A9X0L5Z9_SOLP1|nr:DEAD/DEAH box helicase [Solirubrum puertoriconensis]KUG09156.1 hypothetical protein ASU33_20280 [Solirubrum puertoriconensis]